MTFSEELKARRLELGMTQKEMAQYIGISLATYHDLENYEGGYRGSYPSMATVRKLRRKGLCDFTYLELRTTIDRDRKYRDRKTKYEQRQINKRNWTTRTRC